MGQSPGILSWARCFFIAPFLGSHPHGWLPWTHASSKHAWESEKHKRICVTFPAVTTSLVPPQRAAMFPSLPISFLFGWNPAFFKSKSPSWLVCYCDKTVSRRKNFISTHNPRLQSTNPGKSEKQGLYTWLQNIHSPEQRGMHACMHACLLVLGPISQSQSPGTPA